MEQSYKFCTLFSSMDENLYIYVNIFEYGREI
jgi:hypothetical protein